MEMIMKAEVVVRERQSYAVAASGTISITVDAADRPVPRVGERIEFYLIGPRSVCDVVYGYGVKKDVVTISASTAEIIFNKEKYETEWYSDEEIPNDLSTILEKLRPYFGNGVQVVNP